jgi:hypothetical protein
MAKGTKQERAQDDKGAGGRLERNECSLLGPAVRSRV